VNAKGLIHPGGVFESANAPGWFEDSNGWAVNPASAEPVAL
jgi:hypothetical protein